MEYRYHENVAHYSNVNLINHDSTNEEGTEMFCFVF